jgi:curli biogenesis system outer membrane secretion channel CsgG
MQAGGQRTSRVVRWIAGTVCIVLLLAAGCATPLVRPARPLAPDLVRPVIGVTSFEDLSGFPGPWRLSSGMADLLVSELVVSENFDVVEREHLQSVVSEIQRQVDRLFRSEGRVPLGRLKNAQYLVRGSINDFSQVGGGSAFFALRKLLFGGRSHRARVSLTLTIVDVESGEIVGSVQSHGTARATEAYTEGAYKGVAFGGDAFRKTPLGVATVNAIRRGINELVTSLPQRKWRPLVAAVQPDSTLIINGGRDRGLRVGLVLEARTAGQPVTDPETGDLLTVLPGRVIGRIRIERVDPTVSFGRALDGGGFERGHLLLPSSEPE